MSESTFNLEYIQVTAEIVSAFVGNNAVRASELTAIIEAVHASLLKVSEAKVEEPVSEVKAPAVPVKKSITDEFIICLEDGKKFKSLKRHLSTAYNMSPDDYRAKWGLSRDYPMVAPAYASARSTLARQMGLGRKRDDETDETTGSEAMAEPEVVMDEPEAVMDETPSPAVDIPSDAPRKRGRPRSAKTGAA